MTERQPPTVRTPRLLLRPLEASDRAEYVRGHDDSAEHLRRWSPIPKPGETNDQLFTDELARVPDVEGREVGCRRVAELLPEAARELGVDLGGGRRALVAYVNLNNICRGAFHNADMGWRIMREFAGRGLATEAVVAMLDLAFAPPPRGVGLHRVQANVMPSNTRSLALAERAGFRREGFAPRMLFIAGRWEDHIMHAKLSDEHTPVYLTP